MFLRRSLVVPLLLTSLLMGCKGQAPEEELKEALIRDVVKGELVEEVVESGRIAPSFEVDIKAKVSGEVEKVLVQEGEVVKKGQLLLTLTDTDYRRDVVQAEIGVEQADLQRLNAESELARKAQALQSRGISEFEYDQAKRQLDLAKIQLKSSEVQLQVARDRLGYTRISSPIDGTVITRAIEPGELVTAGVTATVNGEAQLTIAQLDTLMLELDLNQVDVARVQVGMPARVLLDAYPGKEVMGKVTQIAASAHQDTSSGVQVFTVKVELSAAEAGVHIKPGMTAEVRILVGQYPDLIKVPVETVFESEGKMFIYVVKDDAEKPGKKKKEKVEVTVGKRGGRELELTSGVNEGDKIYAQADVKSAQIELD